MLSCLVAGCAVVGPRSIRAGRVAYGEAINQTHDEQLLLSIVKGRYGDSATLMAVNSVVASLKFKAELGVETGFRAAGAPADDLLSAGIAYEENPTITYAPVQGEDYTHQLISPVSLDFLFLLLQSESPDNRAVLSLLVNRVNGIRNPDFLPDSTADPDPRFERLVELFSELGRRGALELVKSTEKTAVFDVWLNPSTPQDATPIGELIDLLGLPKTAGQPKAMVIPAYFGIHTDQSWNIGITTRSTYGLVEILRAAVEVPEAHAAAGLTVAYPRPGLAGRTVHIHSSTRKPPGQSLAVKHRGHWFWIDETDHTTKAAFRLVRTLWSISIARAAHQASPPILTLPVGN